MKSYWVKYRFRTLAAYTETLREDAWTVKSRFVDVGEFKDYLKLSDWWYDTADRHKLEFELLQVVKL